MERAEESLSRAVQALAGAAQQRLGRPPRSIAADPEALERLAAELRLPAVYAAWLRAHSSPDLFDIGLRCGGVSCSLHDVTRVADAQLPYAGQRGWSRDWVVIAYDHEACYVLDLAAARDGDAAVRRVDHGSGNAAIPVADSFVGFLERVAVDSNAADPGAASPGAADPEAPPPDGRLRRRDKLLGVALLGGVIALSTALVLGAMALLAWLLRGCAG